MTIEERIRFLKKLTINLFVFCFIGASILAAILIFAVLKDTCYIHKLPFIAMTAGFFIACIISYLFYDTFKTYDDLETLIYEYCYNESDCKLFNYIVILTHLPFKIRKREIIKKDDICNKDKEEE